MFNKALGFLACIVFLLLCIKNPALSQNEDGVISEGVYWVGTAGMGLKIENRQYQYYDESGSSPWRPVSELEYISEGVVFDGERYWCLSTLPRPINNRLAVCSSGGWVAQ